jgi:geranylgeranyl diphosphate synthase type II
MVVQDCDHGIQADLALIETRLRQMLDRPTNLELSQREPSQVHASESIGAAMREAVFSGGKRIRPLLALRVARILNSDAELALRAAAAVELAHCASLVIDDLPCMDNASHRRGCPALHAHFGEPQSILAAFALVALAADSVVADVRNGEELAQLVAFQRRLLQTLDCNALIGGQAWDLKMTDRERRENARPLATSKTAPLFELAVWAGGVSGVGWSNRLKQLHQFARSLGLLFQAVDDYMDEDAREQDLLQQQVQNLRAQLQSLGREGEELQALVNHLVRSWSATLADKNVLR